MRAALIWFISANLAFFSPMANMGGEYAALWSEAYKIHLINEMEANIEQAAKQETETGAYEVKTIDQVLPEEVSKINHEPEASEETGAEQQAIEGKALENIPQENPTDKFEGSLYAGELDVVPELEKAYEVIVDDTRLQKETAEYLQEKLDEAGIGWFFHYAVLIAYQESNFNPAAENPNGKDKGLFQYRIEYVPWMDWTSPYQQIDYFTQQMANRAARGLTPAEMISCHNQSDYGPYCEDYVLAVMQWEDKLQIR